MKFYLIDKPLELTSFDVIRNLRKKLNISKMGHTGTLDPLASGALLIALGNYTKLIPYFEKDTKEYEFSVKFDGSSDSYDLGTPVKLLSEVEQSIVSRTITKELIEEYLKIKFTGEIEQVPPKYSALKMGGKKALDKVKSGDEFEMKPRIVNILKIEVLNYRYPEADFRATVSAGTYIRSIANDLGNLIGEGGYVTKLRRTKIGSLDISLGQELENFDENKSLDIKELFKNKSFINLNGVMHPNPKLAEAGDTILSKLNCGLSVCGEFDYPIGEDIFVTDGVNVTNIVEYDGKLLKPKKKI